MNVYRAPQQQLHDFCCEVVDDPLAFFAVQGDFIGDCWVDCVQLCLPINQTALTLLTQQVVAED